MKTKLLKVLFSVVSCVAILAAASPSQFNHYQPECPDKLKKYQKN